MVLDEISEVGDVAEDTASSRETWVMDMVKIREEFATVAMSRGIM